MSPENIQIEIDKIALKLNVQSWDLFHFDEFRQNIPRHKQIESQQLSPIATTEIISSLCDDASTHQFHSLCVHPTWIEFASEQIKGTDVKISSVVAFPLGANTTQSKNDEATEIIGQGANNVAFVVNLSQVKEKQFSKIFDEFSEISETCKRHLASSTAIIESYHLNETEIIQLSAIAKFSGINAIMTSTGFTYKGAKAEQVRLIRQVVGESFQVIASGGIRSKDDFNEMLSNGASRVASSTANDLI